MLGEPLGGERHPVHFLRAEKRALRPRLLKNGAGARDRVALNCAAEIGLGDERKHGRGVAQPRAIVGPRDALVALGVESLERRAESAGGARLVPEHRQRSRKLGLAERGREGVELGVGEIAQIADYGAPVARENIERIGERRGIVLVRLRRVDDLVAQPVERLIEGLAAARRNCAPARGSGSR